MSYIDRVRKDKGSCRGEDVRESLEKGLLAEAAFGDPALQFSFRASMEFREVAAVICSGQCESLSFRLCAFVCVCVCVFVCVTRLD
jgi:hypothetical protein